MPAPPLPEAAPHPPRALPRSTLPDRALALLLLLLAALAIWSAQGLVVPFAGDPVGPKAFPTVVALVLGLAALALLLRPGLGWESAGRPWRGIVCIAAMLAYAFIVVPLGFILSTALLCLVIARAFAGNWAQSLLAAALTAPGLFLLLDRVLDLPLPRGPLGF